LYIFKKDFLKEYIEHREKICKLFELTYGFKSIDNRHLFIKDNSNLLFNFYKHLESKLFLSNSVKFILIDWILEGLFLINIGKNSKDINNIYFGEVNRGALFSLLNDLILIYSSLGLNTKKIDKYAKKALLI
jgi:hypothetical protein